MKNFVHIVVSVLLCVFLMLAGVACSKRAEADKQPAEKVVIVWQICPTSHRTSTEPCRVFPDTTWMRTDTWYEIYYMFTRYSDPTDVVSFNSNAYTLKELAYPAE